MAEKSSEKKPAAKSKSIVTKLKEGNERGARHNVIEELFYDFNRSKKQIYLVNLQRGLFFGIGSVIGGTVVIALLVFVLSQFADFLPGVLGDFIQQILNSIEAR